MGKARRLMHATCTRIATRAKLHYVARLQPTAASIYWGPSSAADLAALLSAHATNTQAFDLPSIPRDAELKTDILPLEAIKSKHCFVYERNICRAFERTNEVAGQPFSFTVLS